MPQLGDLSGLLSGLGRILQLAVVFLGAYLFAVWISMIIWTFRDIRARARYFCAVARGGPRADF